MKKRLITALLAGVMASSMVMPAMAEPGGAVPASTGTDIWAGVIIEDKDAKVKVEVPTLFAFVVKGTTDVSNTSSVTSANGDIYLPNVKVDVTTPSTNGQGAVYNLQTEGNLTVEGKLPFTNYSTFKNISGRREGLAVKINGNIKNEGDDASRKYWTHTTSSNTGTDDFKKYNISIDGNKFDTVANGGLQMSGAGINLAAPNTDPLGDLSYSNVDSNDYATVGETHHAKFDVSVGGKKGQYKQVEESAKIGNIVWTISVEMQGDVDTAPNEDYLQP
ncbi:hypothetical protein [Lacrimispora indolis]|uniref:hypothetical protein n=1 Tax=Lacrimispora indolis TaxID=69825 RepID=UPI00045EA122|nr:hypothetical protein [Lacrimispora indolis]